ncbi:hypothetical protein BST61_g9604 [Cercospora zeina]
MALRYDTQVAIVTGAGSGLGRTYALLLASRGARVVVNDLGVSLTGEAATSNGADEVVRQIRAAGGEAIADYHSVEQGEAIVRTAISAFGAVHIVINNAGILRDVSFGNMTDAQWDSVHLVHVKGAVKTTQAAWPYFRAQRFGRIILTSSAAGLYGNFGRCNYSAAKAALIGLGETLAKEGSKYNIRTNIIAPIAATRMTATVLEEKVLRLLASEWVAPLVARLVHTNNGNENGSIFELGGGYVSKLRWERSRGLLVKPDATLGPGVILDNWSAVNDFTNPDFPTTTADLVGLLKRSQQLPSNQSENDIRFDGRVAIVTGGGAGLGRAYCLLLARLGAAVVVNDYADPDPVVHEIIRLGGKAVAAKCSAEDGDAVIQIAKEKFGGRVDVLINNAGILRDKSFQNMTDELWDQVYNVHLRSTYKTCKAAWPIMVKQGYGRIINTTSTSGIYGNFGQTNYAAAKAGIIGLSKSLAIEGREYNIRVNTISPSAGTALTADVLPEEVVRTRKPDYVAPIVVLLASDQAPKDATGQLFESGCGWQARTRLQRSKGYHFPLDKVATPEDVRHAWHHIVDFSSGHSSPEVASETRKLIMANQSAGIAPKSRL